MDHLWLLLILWFCKLFNVEKKLFYFYVTELAGWYRWSTVKENLSGKLHFSAIVVLRFCCLKIEVQQTSERLYFLMPVVKILGWTTVRFPTIWWRRKITAKWNSLRIQWPLVAACRTFLVATQRKKQLRAWKIPKVLFFSSEEPKSSVRFDRIIIVNKMVFNICLWLRGFFYSDVRNNRIYSREPICFVVN